MCGGVLEIVLCSHVGHIFRTFIPYKVVSGSVNIVRQNSIRLAEVWLDDYKKYYYERINFDLVSSQLNQELVIISIILFVNNSTVIDFIFSCYIK